MGPLDKSNHAIQEYANNVQERESAPAAGHTVTKKRLVSIGTGENQYIDCWDDNWTLPFKCFAAFFRGGFSLPSFDFGKITEHYFEKNLKKIQFLKKELLHTIRASLIRRAGPNFRTSPEPKLKALYWVGPKVGKRPPSRLQVKHVAGQLQSMPKWQLSR